MVMNQLEKVIRSYNERIVAVHLKAYEIIRITEKTTRIEYKRSMKAIFNGTIIIEIIV